MNDGSGWIQEAWRIVFVAVAALAVGLVFDRVTLFLLLGLLLYTLRNLYNLQRLAVWAGDPQTDRIPVHFGLWGDVYSRIARVSARQAQREQRLRTLLNEYTASTSALPDAAVALDSADRIRWFNEAASRLLGLLPAQDVGQPLSNLLRNPEVSAFIRAKAYGGSLEITIPGDDSERRLEIRLAPYGEGQTLLLAQDITERLRQERMRRDFVANVSHELRTPLTVLSGFVENLQNDDGIRDERLTRPLELMAQQATRMRQIVEDLLLLARLESDATPSPRVEVDVAALLRLVADECRTLDSRTPRIECRVESQRRVLGDEQQLRSAVTNLVVNAVHHTPADGSITLSWTDEGGASVLEVADTGEGIAPPHIPRLTERFYRVDAGRSRERGGTGLGLAIVKHVLNRHGARLEIRSRLGEGSRFACRFPASSLVD